MKGLLLLDVVVVVDEPEADKLPLVDDNDFFSLVEDDEELVLDAAPPPLPPFSMLFMDSVELSLVCLLPQLLLPDAVDTSFVGVASLNPIRPLPLPLPLLLLDFVGVEFFEEGRLWWW